jgi:hypothetical protein
MRAPVIEYGVENPSQLVAEEVNLCTLSVPTIEISPPVGKLGVNVVV